MYENECDVFIAGSGVSGLYAAILLSKIGLSVHISDSSSNTTKQTTTNDLLLFSPRSLQLLSQLDLLPALTQKGCGTRHWKFDLYHNKGYGSQAITVEQQSNRLWENETTEYNYSLSCPKSIVIDILTEYLEREEGIQIDELQELIDIEEKKPATRNSSNVYSSSAADLTLYYQYRPLPPISPPMDDDDEHVSRKRAIKSIHLKHKETNQVVIWKSQAIIGADGFNSGQTNFVRQKLGIALKNYNINNETRIFYTLQINITSTNFPSVRQISTLCKNKDILYIIGHQTRLYITFEHKPNWTKLSIDDEIPVALAIRHIKAMMEPFQIEFGKVISYNRWNGNNIGSCEDYTIDPSFYFLVGSAAHNLNPPGIFDINVNLDQVQNLCWKLALSLQHSASPKLLETFESENKLKIEEAMQVSTLFSNLIGDYYKEENQTNSLNASHIRDCLYQLRRLKNCFVGTTPLTANILNSQTEEDLEDNMTINSSTPSFVFMAPPPSATKSSGSLLSNTLGVVNLATAGYLAPNAKLKPYTLFQLLLMSPTSAQSAQQQKPALATTMSSQELNTTSSNEEQLVATKNNNKKHTLVISTKNLNNKDKSTRQRSNSVTSSSTTNIWSVLPIFQKSSQFMKRTSLVSTVTPTISTSSSNTISAATTTVTSPVATTAATTTASALISAERWKSIKPNHLQLLDRIQSFNKNGCTFTILIFCGSITETQEKTKNFVKLLMSPVSFLYRFERAITSRDHHRNSMVSIGSPTADRADRRLSVLSNSSNSGGRKSFEQQRRNSNDSSSYTADPTRFSMSTMSSASTYNNNHLLAQQQRSSLFSILFISNSNKSEAVKYLNNTPPATVHSTFPSGLAQVFLDHDGQCYKAYNINKKQQGTEVVVVRPDGYIGTRVPILQGQEEEGFDRLSHYFNAFLRPPVDMNSAAAVVAAGYE